MTLAAKLKRKIKWAKEDHETTTFFHKVATVRKLKSKINHLKTNGAIVEGQAELSKAFLDHCKQLLGETFKS